jgi:hypothetical protein
MKWITVNDLVQWAGNDDCHQNLPLLIKKLIEASVHTDSIEDKYIPYGDQNYIPGFDVSLNCEEKVYTVDRGISRWEIGCDKDILKKANGDFDKRINESNTEISKKDTTYVFVTPRVWTKSKAWESEKRELSIWKNVIVITAIELDDWIDSHPAVALWLTYKIGKLSVNDIEKVEDVNAFWTRWAKGRNNTLIPKLLLGGREEAKNKIYKAISSTDVLTINSVSKEDAFAFIVAAILTAENHESLISRTVLAYDVASVKQLIEQYENLIIVTNVSQKSFFHAKDKKHTIIYATSSDDVSPSVNSVDLPKIDRDCFVETLKECGVHENNAEELSRETKRNITILRRKLDFDESLPEWAKPDNIGIFIPAILLGKWNDSVKGDQEIIELITDGHSTEFLTDMQNWLHRDDSPIVKVGSSWCIKSATESFLYGYKYITSHQFDKYKEALQKCLDDVDPDAIEKAETNELKFWTNRQKYTGWLKEGLLQSSIMISINGEDYKMSTPQLGNVWIDDIFQDTFNKASYEWILSYEKYSVLIAEAAPAVFLKFIEDDIKNENSIIKKIFRQENINLHTGIKYGKILFALEALAWQKEYLLRVTNVLLCLSGIENESNYGNKPINSLSEIYKIWHPQTLADLNCREQSLDSAMKKNRTQCYKLCFSLVNRRGNDVASPTHPFRWRNFGLQRPNSFSRLEVAKTIEFIVKLMLRECNKSHEELNMLLDLIDNTALINRELRTEILDFLFDKVDYIKKEQVIADKIKDILNDNILWGNDIYKQDEENVNKLKELLKAIEPNEPMAKNAWLFKDMFLDIPEIHKIRTDYVKMQELKLSIRSNALKEICNESDIFIFSNKVNNARSVGEAYAYYAEKTSFRAVIQAFKEKLIKIDFAQGFYVEWQRKYGVDIFLKDMDGVKEEFDDYIYIPLTSMSSDRRIWNYVEKLNPHVQNKFWSLTDTWVSNNIEETEYVVEKYNKVNNVRKSVQLLHDAVCLNHLVINTELIINTLMCSMNNLSNVSSYEMTDLLLIVDKREDANPEKLYFLEILFNDFIKNHPDFKETRIVKDLISKPEFMFDVIRNAYHSKDEEQRKKEENELMNDKNKMNRAIISHRILFNFPYCPYVKDSETIDESALNYYVDKLKELANQHYRVEITDEFIGHLLANYPKIDYFPNEVICNIIERLDNKDINRGYSVRIFNQQGMTVRGPYEGGDIERNKSDIYRKIAEDLRFKYPVMSEIYDDLSKQYKSDAKIEDMHAEITDMEY